MLYHCCWYHERHALVMDGLRQTCAIYVLRNKLIFTQQQTHKCARYRLQCCHVPDFDSAIETCSSQLIWIIWMKLAIKDRLDVTLIQIEMPAISTVVLK